MPLNCVPRLLQLEPGCGDARLQLADALGIGALPRRGPLQLDGCGVGAVLRLLALAGPARSRAR